MDSIETTMYKKVDQYVFTTRLLFFLLGGILLVRVYKPNGNLFVSVYHNVILLLIPVILVVVITAMMNKRRFKNQGRFEFFINLLYLVVVVFLLTFESESFFNFLLLMPVMVSSLRYGIKQGYLWASLSTAGIVIIAFFDKTGRIDVEILVTGIIWLVAWLLGKMTETEMEVREELQKLAAIDGLTGVFNHRSFHRILDEFLLKAKLAQSSLTLVMIDVDFFKYYNDSYGHQKGDEVLRKLAELIEKGVGNRGVCARYGGDEFAVLLPDCDGKSGVQVGETIRKLVEETKFEGMNILPGGHFTLSIGVASYPAHAISKEQLLQKSDEALYKAKDTNANKVELYYSVFDEIEDLLQDKEKDMLSSMRTLLMVVNAKDKYTYGHSERVMHYSVETARKLALWEWEIQDLMMGALLHDIGKIEIEREILNKNGKLTSEEWESIRMHPLWGADIIRPIPSFGGAVNIILYHHENYDGSGYPHGVKGQEIPLGARILRLADSFDAMTTNRPYKNTKSIRQAVSEIKELKGIFYDPEIVDAFMEYISEAGILTEEVS